MGSDRFSSRTSHYDCHYDCYFCHKSLWHSVVSMTMSMTHLWPWLCLWLVKMSINLNCPLSFCPEINTHSKCTQRNRPQDLGALWVPSNHNSDSPVTLVIHQSLVGMKNTTSLPADIWFNHYSDSPVTSVIQHATSLLDDITFSHNSDSSVPSVIALWVPVQVTVVLKSQWYSSYHIITSRLLEAHLYVEPDLYVEADPPVALCRCSTKRGDVAHWWCHLPRFHIKQAKYFVSL